MKEMNRDLIIELADELNFSLSELEIVEISEEFNVLMDQIDLLNAINTEKIEPMVYPFEEPIVYFREDVVNHVLPVNEALKNTQNKQDGYVIVPKVIK